MILSVCMVAHNEETRLGGILSDLLRQDFPHGNTQLLLCDNASSDGTLRMLNEFSVAHRGEYAGIEVIRNPHLRQATGLNLCLDRFRGDVLIRVDAHASLDPAFLSESAACLEGTHTGIREDVCGGVRPTYTLSDAPMARLLWLAEESRFGASTASYRRAPDRCYVKSVFHPAYRREVVERVGRFDERLWRTEDNNYNYRVRQAGYRICFEPRIRSAQQVRPTLGGMLRQKYQNGYWIGLTLALCPGCLSLFHFVPFCFLCALVFCLSLAVGGFPLLLRFLLALYGLAAILCTAEAILHIKWHDRHPLFLLMPLLFFAMHLCYGAGTAVGLASIPFKARKRTDKV